MVQVITDADFETEVLQKEGLYLVDFWATWCGPCQMMGPVVDLVAEEYAGKLSVGKVNVDENREMAMKYGIQSIPTLLFFRGGEVVHRLIGLQPKPHLEATIQYLLGK